MSSDRMTWVGGLDAVLPLKELTASAVCLNVTDGSGFSETYLGIPSRRRRPLSHRLREATVR